MRNLSNIFKKKALLRGVSMISALALVFTGNVIPEGKADADAATVVEIRTADELRKVGASLDATYILMNDIDLSDTVYGGAHTNEGGWVPLDNFNGTFDGNGYTIKNLNIYANANLEEYEEYNLALFKSIDRDAIVKNLNIQVNISKASSFDDKFGAIAGFNNGHIENCHVSGEIACNLTADQLTNPDYDFDDVTDSERVRIGGVAARNQGTIKNCYSNINITTNNPAAYVGGITGGNAGGDSYDSYNTGKISADNT
ncbi:MAG: hypothetical protein K6G11_02910, partial [Lachnospiraceae bacterium]|nr:hypothetical protein [Lachnospiraceae bacterium]